MKHLLRRIARSLDENMPEDHKRMYDLRRSLLSCNYYDCGLLNRFFYILKLNRGVFASFFAGFIIISTGVFVLDNLLSSNHNIVPVSVLKSDRHVDYYQSLYNHGYLHYEHQNSDGSRIYSVNNNDRHLMVVDSVPYKIHMVLAN